MPDRPTRYLKLTIGWGFAAALVWEVLWLERMDTDPNDWPIVLGLLCWIGRVGRSIALVGVLLWRALPELGPAVGCDAGEPPACFVASLAKYNAPLAKIHYGESPVSHSAYESEQQARQSRTLLDQLPAQLDASMLAGIDQFHAGGAEPVARLLRSGGVREGMTIVDLGSGLGGPARLAAALGATVIGIDRSPSFVHLATALSTRSGRSDRVSFRVGDMTSVDLPDHVADRVMLIHAQMNVPNKVALARSIARLLRPGGALLLWEICAAGDGDVSWPTPWSLDGHDSHLVSASDLRGALEQGGLQVTDWADRTEWAGEWFRRTLSAPPAAGPAGPSLAGFLERGPERLRNFARAVATGQVALIEGIAHA